MHRRAFKYNYVCDTFKKEKKKKSDVVHLNVCMIGVKFSNGDVSFLSNFAFESKILLSNITLVIMCDLFLV